LVGLAGPAFSSGGSYLTANARGRKWIAVSDQHFECLWFQIFLGTWI
jgi:hypothetical protein